MTSDVIQKLIDEHSMGQMSISLADYICDQMKHMESVQSKVGKISKEINEELKRHKIKINTLQNSLEKLQKECKHLDRLRHYEYEEYWEECSTCRKMFPKHASLPWGQTDGI